MDKSSLIVGDIGGTNTRLGLMRFDGVAWQLGDVEVIPTPADVPAAVKAWWRAQGSPALLGAALCGAGPLKEGCIALTNTAARVDAREIAQALGTQSVLVLNDFEALAWALPVLATSELKTIQQGQCDREAPMLVLGPGTGFGAAALLRTAWGQTVVSGEGGHALLALPAEPQPGFWKKLECLKGPLTIEKILSGNGFAGLHQALTDTSLTATQVAEAAWRGEPAAMQAVETFVIVLAQVAADLALTFGARGGVFIGGGIVPHWGEHFPLATFQREFGQRTEMRELLLATPVSIITAPYPALLGLAAAFRLREKFQTLGG